MRNTGLEKAQAGIKIARRNINNLRYADNTTLTNPGIEPRSPTLQPDSLPAEPPGKLKNTGVDSLGIPSPADLPNPGIEPGSPRNMKWEC